MDENAPNELTSLRSEKQQQIIVDKMPKNYSEKKSQWIQIACSVMANASVLSAGMGLGFPAITIQTLTKQQGFTEDQFSWFGENLIISINTLVSPLGGILSATILDSFGRKKTLIVINVLSIVSWGLLYFSSKTDFNQMLWQVMFGRFLIGKINSFMYIHKSQHNFDLKASIPV
jgi:MFS family permease